MSGKKRTTKSRTGTGSVFQRSDGQWAGTLRYKDPVTGKPSRRTVYGKTRGQATEKLEEMRGHLAADQPVQLSKDSTGAAVRHWATTILPLSSRKPSTVEDRQQQVEARIIPMIGDVPLADLTPDRINLWAAQLLEGTQDFAPMAPSSVRKLINMLAVALDHTVETKQLRVNPARAKSIAHPPDEHSEVHWYSSDEIHRLRVAMVSRQEPHRLDPLITLLIETGMRRGEALGLRWKDVDLEGRKARISGGLVRVRKELVRQSPKTAGSARVIPLTDRAVEALREAQRWQELDQDASEHWRNSAGYCFTVAHGGPVDPRNLGRHFDSVKRLAKIHGGSLHSLRHSWATALLLAGQPIHAVSKLLGHSSIRMTADTYSHASDEDFSAIVASGLVGYGEKTDDNVIQLRA